MEHIFYQREKFFSEGKKEILNNICSALFFQKTNKKDLIAIPLGVYTLRRHCTYAQGDWHSDVHEKLFMIEKIANNLNVTREKDKCGLFIL